MAEDDKEAARQEKKWRERLKMLSEEWERSEAGYGYLSSLTAADLRLLLESHLPTRALIRAIAVGGEAQTEEASPRSAEAPTPTFAAEDEAAHAEARRLQEEVQELRVQNAELKKHDQEARRQLSELESQLRDAQRDALRAKNEKQALARELDDLRRQPPLGEAGTALAALCDRPQLQQHMGLQGLRMDVDSLVRMVAILAQKDNIEQLLKALGEEAQKRATPLADDERALLGAALTWLNYNWPTMPYRLVWPALNDPFDFDAHVRAKSTPTGETIAAVLTPGLQDGRQNWVRKPLVMTR